MASSNSKVTLEIIGEDAKLIAATKRSEQAIARVADEAEKNSRKMQEWGAKVGIASTVVAAGLWKAGEAASDQAESASKAATVFGAAYGSIDKWASTTAETMGQSRTAALENAAAFGLLGKSAGLTGNDLATFSQGLTSLSSDFASFYNVDVAQASEALSSAFRGEFDSLQRFIPTINAAAVEQHALQMGLAGSTSELTAQQKVLATQDYIMKNAGDAAGDFARTADGVANSQRTAKAEIDDMVASLGTHMLPVMKTGIGAVSGLVDAFTSLPQPMQDILIYGTMAASGLGMITGGISSSVQAFGAAKDMFSSLASKIGGGGGGGGGLAGALAGGLNPAVLAGTAAIGIGLGVYEAWSSAAEEVEAKVKKLTDSIAEQGDSVLPSLQASFRATLGDNEDLNDAFRKTGFTIGDMARAAEQGGGSIDKWRDANRAAFENLTNGADKSSVSMQQLRGSLGDLSPQYRSIIDHNLDLVESGKLSDHEFRLMADHMVDLGKGSQSASDALAFQAQQLKDTVGNTAAAREATALFNAALSDSSSVTQRREALSALIAQFPEAAKESGIALAAEKDLAKGMDGTTAAAKGSTSALGDTSGALGDNAKASEDAKKAMDDFASALSASFDPLFTADDATRKLEDAQRKVMVAASEHGTKSPEYIQAVSDATRAVIGQESANIRLKGAIDGGQVSVDEMKRKLAEWVSTGKITQDEADVMAFKFGFAARQANEISSKVSTTVTADTSQANSALQSIVRDLNNAAAAGRNMTGAMLHATMKIQQRASGGPVKAGTTYLIGEEGPELVTFGANGFVTPNDKLGAAVGGPAASFTPAPSGGGGQTINVTIQTGVGDPVAIGQELARVLEEYGRHGGTLSAKLIAA